MHFCEQNTIGHSKKGLKIGGTTVSADTGKAVLDELGLGLEQTALGNMGAKLDAFNNIFRPLMVTGDLAGAMIQGGMSAFTNTGKPTFKVGSF